MEESQDVGRPTLDAFKEIPKNGRQAMGVQGFSVDDGLTTEFVKGVNAVLRCKVCPCTDQPVEGPVRERGVLRSLVTIGRWSGLSEAAAF